MIPKIIAVAIMLMANVLTGCSSADTMPDAAASNTTITPTPKLPSFNFRGLVPGKTTPADATRHGIVTGCENLSGTISCDLRKLSVGDVRTYQFQTVARFKRGVFDTLDLPFDAANYERLVETVTKAYGQPCEVKIGEISNSFGATLAQRTSAWCFKEGKLTAYNHDTGDNSRYQGNLFFFTHQSKTPVPKVDPKSI